MKLRRVAKLKVSLVSWTQIRRECYKRVRGAAYLGWVVVLLVMVVPKPLMRSAKLTR